MKGKFNYKVFSITVSVVLLCCIIAAGIIVPKVLRANQQEAKDAKIKGLFTGQATIIDRDNPDIEVYTLETVGTDGATYEVAVADFGSVQSIISQKVIKPAATTTTLPPETTTPAE